MATNFFKNWAERRFLAKMNNVENLKNASDEDQIRWFTHPQVTDEQRKTAALKWAISPFTKSALWDEYHNLLAPFVGKILDKQFELLLIDDEETIVALKQYIASHTLSVEQLRMFISHVDKLLADNKADLVDFLHAYIRQHGYPTELVYNMWNCDKRVAEAIRNAIDINYHVDMVKYGTLVTVGNSTDVPTDQFKHYLCWLKKEGKSMPVEAQTLMQYNQLMEYYKLGLKLDKKAIEQMCINLPEHASAMIIHRIFEFQEVYPLWPELEDVLSTKSRLFNIYINVNINKQAQAQ